MPSQHSDSSKKGSKKDSTSKDTGTQSSVAEFLTGSELDKYMKGATYSTDQLDVMAGKMASTSINGIEGVPYQFPDSVDRRITGTSLGRKYGEKIFSRMPLLFLTPCEPVFMDDFNNRDKDLIASALGGVMKATDALELLGKGYEQKKYYSVDFNYTGYYDILNAMLTCVAVYMGIQDEYVTLPNGTTKKVGSINWAEELNDDFKTYYSSGENLVFYLDGLNQVSESFNNDTGESSLSGIINGLSESTNEILFLIGREGNNAASMIEKSLSEGQSKLTESITGLASTAGEALAGGIVGSLLNGDTLGSIMNGGKIVFPKIWKDSSFSRSYALDIKLRSPDHDSLSIFLNVIKPYCKILALTMPRSVTNNDPNIYRSPFLVKAACKGLFSVDMGIISSLSVTKGAQCCWNDDGLPTQIDISLTIDDLYSSMHSNGYNGLNPWNNANFLFNSDKAAIAGIVNNTAYQDYLANLAGLNILQTELGRKVKLSYYLTSSYVQNIPSNIGLRFDESLSRIIGKLWRKV